MRNHKEDDLQRACVTWFNLQYPELRGLLFAIPNGGKRNAREAARMKSQGVVAGIPDLMLAIPCENNHGLFFELKAGNNKPAEKQEVIMKLLGKRGYDVSVIYSFDEFRGVIEFYFKYYAIVKRY